MNTCRQIVINDYLKPVVVVGFMIVIVALLMPDLSFAQEGWGDWDSGQDGWDSDPGSQVTDERMNVFLGSSDIYVKSGIAAVAGVIVYVLFLFLFKMLVSKMWSPTKVFTVIFSSLLISWYAVLFICFSEYTVIQAYAADISVADYLKKLNLQLVLFSFFGWVVLSLIISTILRGNAASNA